ncbi:MAG: dihydrofolate reductase [Proteobacteria bacterium]|nr:dihydrofolate reductase [Pseudomonadota bacterium]
MKFSHIVACSQNRVIGRQSQIPWHIPEDLKLFKQLTSGHIIIMGRKTFESIGRALPMRLTIVISRQMLHLPGEVRQARSLEAARSMAQELSKQWGNEAFIVGGGEIYAQSLDWIDRIYQTQVPKQVEGDTFYPEISLDDFELSQKTEIAASTPFTFCVYDRKPKG